MMYSNVIVDITIFRGSFVFSQSRVKVSASLTDVECLAVGAFDLGSLVSKCRNVVLGVGNTDVVAL